MTTLLVLAILAPGAAQDFEEAFRAADGPAALRELGAWCLRNKLKEEQSRVSALLATLAPARPSADHAAREAARARRQEALKAVRDFTDGRARAAAEEIAKIADWMRKEKFAPPGARARLGDLSRRLAGTEPPPDLEHQPRPAGEEKKLASEFASRSSAALKAFADRLLAAADLCLKAGEPGYAFDLFQRLLEADPDNERARRSLGQVRLGDRWLRPYDLEQARAGLAWDDRFGWIAPREKPRYERGEIIEELNRRHARPEDPWKFRSEHFEVFSTADLAATADLVSKLEAFFLQAFRQYDLFFGGAKGARLILGVAPARKPLRVHFYRDADQFKSHARPDTDWAAGFYDSGRRASFFYAMGGTADLRVLRHEITHQILWEFGGGGIPPMWLMEGAAICLEGGPSDDTGYSFIRAYRENLRAGMQEHPFQEVVRLQTDLDWKSGDVSRHYRGAGAAFAFLMRMDGGRCRSDLVEMLRDAYAGRARPVEEYFGLSTQGLGLLMERFYK